MHDLCLFYGMSYYYGTSGTKTMIMLQPTQLLAANINISAMHTFCPHLLQYV